MKNEKLAVGKSFFVCCFGNNNEKTLVFCAESWDLAMKLSKSIFNLYEHFTLDEFDTLEEAMEFELEVKNCCC